MNLQYIWKNVNKQLKSADFLSEMSKFQKNLLKKVFSFLKIMWKPTLIFLVLPSNGQKSYDNIHVLLLTAISKQKSFHGQIFDILSATTQFWNLWKKIQRKLHSTLAKVGKTTKQGKNQQIFPVTLTEKFSMPDYWYKLYKFTQYTWALNSSLFWRI